MEEILYKKPIFNPDGNDDVEERKIIKGTTTNLFNLNNVKYQWANNLYRGMMANFWIPEKVPLGNDNIQYPELTKYDQRAYDGILSRLVFLDSIQTTNLPNISNYITAPEVNLILAIQDYQEAIHSQSYAYIIENCIPANKREKIYDFWRNDKVLFEINQYIANVYQKFLDKGNDENFVRVLVANYLLEGLFFYNGFNFFYNLANRNLMLGSATSIKYINRDELTHCAIFEGIINAIKNEYPNLISMDMIIEMIHIAVEQEIKWSQHIIGNNVLGIDDYSIDRYTKWTANYRAKKMGIKEILYSKDEYQVNPYKHLEKIADLEDQGENKTGFFEGTVTSYNQSTVLTGWNNF